MRGKTKNFIENILILSFLSSIVYGGYFYYYDANSKKIEKAPLENVEDIELAAKEYLKRIEKLNSILTTTTPKVEKIDKIIVEIIPEKNIIPQEENNKTIVENTDKNNTIEKVINIAKVIDKNNTIEIKSKSILIQVKKVDTNSSLEILTNEELMEVFLNNTKNKINSSIKQKQGSNQSTQQLKIRITILKNGNYEQLKLLVGDIEYFNSLKETILKNFPVDMDNKIDDQFPRYFRMTI